MALIILFVLMLLFMLFFYLIGLRFVGLLPLFIFIILAGYYANTISLREQSTRFLERYGLWVAWLVLLWWVASFLHFFGIETVTISLIIIALNVFLRLCSYIVPYKDGTIVFQWWYYITTIFLLFYTLLHHTTSFFDVFMLNWILWVGIMAFIVCVISLWFPTQKNMQYLLWVGTLWAILLVVFAQIQQVYIVLTIDSIIIWAVCFGIYHILSKRPPSKEQIKQISVRRILAGERILEKNDTSTSHTYKRVYMFLDQMPKYIKYMIEWLTLLILLIAIISYLQSIGNAQWWLHQWLYWSIIVLFLLNNYFLKKVGFTSILQRLAIFLVINFAIYVSLFSLLWGNVGNIVWWAILWNIASTVMIFYSHHFTIAKILKKMDYVFWIVAALIALITNCILLGGVDVAGQLLFSLIFLYAGIQGMIMFYAIRYIRWLPDEETP